MRRWFVTVGCLWWMYFDRVVDPSAVERAFSNGVREVLAGFGWSYSHLAIAIGLTAAAVGIEVAIVDASEATLQAVARPALCGGVALALAATTALHRVFARGLPRGAARARFLGAAFVLSLAVAAGRLAPLVLMALLCVALVGLTASEVVCDR